ncbi:MAG: MalY/PatB family protein [Pseudomonadota bacterium]
MNFDKIIDRVGTHSAKWDMLPSLYGLNPAEAISMWVADMDFEPPQDVTRAVRNMADHGVYGYYADPSSCNAAISGWMDRRHGWSVDPNHIFYTHGLVNAVGLCLCAYSKPGDGIVIFTPVYHAFARTIKAADRTVVECPLVQNNGRYEMDFDAYDAMMTGAEKVLILCSPHNPGGRVWTAAELQGLAAFAKRHDLLILSDDIHHDITLGTKYVPIENAAPDCVDRLVMLTAASKTFNIAGTHTGNVIIKDDKLRQTFSTTMQATGISPNSFGMAMVEAAYAHGDTWVDGLCAYIAENARIFDEGIAAVPGLKSMPLEATYLAWVDFADTGMTAEEYRNRVVKTAKIAPNYGETFGTGGETFLRFNLGTQRARVVEAVERLQDAFADLQ